MHYCSCAQSLRVTTDLAAGVTTKLWSIADMVSVIEWANATHEISLIGFN